MPLSRRTHTQPQRRLILARAPPQRRRAHQSQHTSSHNQHPLLPQTTHQQGAAVSATQSDRYGRSAEARHGDLPPLQPPDQSLNHTSLVPPPSSRCGQPDSGQGHQGSTGVRRVVVVVPSPNWPLPLSPQHLSGRAAVRTQEKYNPEDKTVEHRGGMAQSSRLVLPLLDFSPGHRISFE